MCIKKYPKYIRIWLSIVTIIVCVIMSGCSQTGNSNIEKREQPEPEQPEPEQSEPEQPEPEQSEPEQPEPEQPEQPEPEHPVLEIPLQSESSADNILSSWSEQEYLDSFIPKQSPRNMHQDNVPMVVSGDSSWQWNISEPSQLTSLPSGTVFPNENYPILTETVQVLSGGTVEVPYYMNVDGSAKSLVFAAIDYWKVVKLRGHLQTLAGAYMASGDTHINRNQAYARRIALALHEWAKYFPDYFMTEKNDAVFIHADTDYILSADVQRASDHNGLAHEWKDGEVLAFDAIYDSPALDNLSAELGYDARDFIVENFFENEGDFFVNRVPTDLAIVSNLSGPFGILADVARILKRQDYLAWMDDYLGKTTREKIRRDGVLTESYAYSMIYLETNEEVANKTLNYFITHPADTPELQAIKTRAESYVTAFEEGKIGLEKIALPNGQFPSIGDTGFGYYFPARNSGSSALLPAFGAVSMGAGTDSESAVQLSQNFTGHGTHLHSDATAFTLWAFGHEYLGNVRYLNGAAGRRFAGEILAHNAVTIDRTDMVSPEAFTYGNGNLTLYEPGIEGIAVTEIDGQRAYENKASRYQRIMLLNSHDIEKPYVVDVMRVNGGATHDYTLHGSIMYDQTWESSHALNPSAEVRPLLEEGETWVYPTGQYEAYEYYGLWENVSSNIVQGAFEITYRDSSDLKRDLRLWMTGDGTWDVYVGETPVPDRQKSYPSDWWVNDLWRPSTIIRKRIPSGTLDSLFVSVIEPMKNGVSIIKNVERLSMIGNNLESLALKITFFDDRVDTYLVNLNNPNVAGAQAGNSSVSTLDGKYVLNGRVGVHMDGAAGESKAWSVNASSFEFNGQSLTHDTPRYSGVITGETRKIKGAQENAFTTSTPLPLGTVLQGKHLSLTFGSLDGYGTTNISELFVIDRVIAKDGEYLVTFVQDHQLEINGSETIEQVAPLRTFNGLNTFEITLSATVQRVSVAIE